MLFQRFIENYSCFGLLFYQTASLLVVHLGWLPI